MLIKEMASWLWKRPVKLFAFRGAFFSVMGQKDQRCLPVVYAARIHPFDKGELS